MSVLTVENFTFEHENKFYVVSGSEDNKTVFAEGVQGGEKYSFEMCNMSSGSGNEHLRYALHGLVITEYVRRCIERFKLLTMLVR